MSTQQRAREPDTRARRALQPLNVFMADMQAGIGPFRRVLAFAALFLILLSQESDTEADDGASRSAGTGS